jgi:Rieske Fe-S protein
MTTSTDPGRDPLWRDEFPVQAEDERYVTRRQFTKFLMLTSVGMFAGNLWILVRSWFRRPVEYPAQVIARSGDLRDGQVVLFNYPTANDPCILLRTPDRAVRAYSQKCTHLSCAVVYNQTANQLECPCHRGFFSALDGSVLAGPPPRPLPRVRIEERGGNLVAVGMVEEA